MAPTPRGVRGSHEDYDEMLPVWEKCRTVAEGGTRALREAREKYLPRYLEEDDDSYRNRLNRTTLYNASWRVMEGCRGLLLRKPPVITVPDSVLPLLQNVNLAGMDMGTFIGEVIEEVLKVGRVGIWINYPATDSSATAADAALLGLRPSAHIIEAEEFDNWATRTIGNKTVLSMVKIIEEIETNVDEFTVSCEQAYRVLDLVDVPDDATGAVNTIYRVRLMQYDKNTSTDVTLETFYPKMGGKHLDHIPFHPIGPDCNEMDVDAPPFDDLVDQNLAHWEQTSSYRNGCFLSGLPQPVICGWEPKPGEKLRLSSVAWAFPTVGTKVSLLEVGSQGFVALKDDLKGIEEKMILLGSRSLELQHAGGQESQSTAALHLSGEHSVLSSMGHSMSAGLTASFKEFVAWTGNDPSETTIRLTDDFFDEPTSPEKRLSVVKSWQSGAISDEAKFNLLKQSGDYAPDVTFEQEQLRIQQSTGLATAAKPIKDQPLADQLNPNVPDSNPQDPQTQDQAPQTTQADDPMPDMQQKPMPDMPMPDMAAHHAAMQASADQQTAILDKISTAMSQPQAAPIVNIAAQPAPIVNIAAPVINVPEQPPINVNIAPAAVTVNTPDVNVAAPNVNVASPTVNVTTPDVTVNQPTITVNTPAVNVAQPSITVNVPEQKEIPPQPAPVVVNT